MLIMTIADKYLKNKNFQKYFFQDVKHRIFFVTHYEYIEIIDQFTHPSTYQLHWDPEQF
jgi:uncharacterized protein YlaI